MSHLLCQATRRRIFALAAILFAVCLFSSPSLPGQSSRVEFDPFAETLSFETNAESYYIVQESPTLQLVFEGGTIVLGDGQTQSFSIQLGQDQSFFRVTAAALDDPGDIDGDGIDDLFELDYDDILDLFDGSDGFIDSDGDGQTNLWEYQRGFDPRLKDTPTTFTSSPSNGANDVAVTHETVLYFTRPLAGPPGQFDIEVEAAGLLVPKIIYTSSDLRTVTVFYRNGLPGSSQVRITIKPTDLRDENGDELDLDGDGEPGGLGVIDFNTHTLSSLEGTSIGGRVFASELGVEGSELPLSAATITVDGRENDVDRKFK